ncbi:MAG: serine hydrolase domain-containing protein [Limnochordia bacterium]
MRTLVTGDPEKAGLDPNQLNYAYQTVERWSEARKIPGAVLAIGRHGILVGPRAIGLASLEPEEKPLRPDALYDLASVTKVVATTTCALMLIEHGAMRLDDPVSFFLPEFKHETVAIRHLLTHSSGLPAWRPLYQSNATPQEMISTLMQLPLEYETGQRVVYSCLGYILLAQVIEHVSATPLDELARTEVFAPLGMLDTMYRPDAQRRQRAVPTERDSRTGQFKQGVVHDENAFGLGGVSGNAGLFSTAADTAIFCQMLLNKGCYGATRILSPAMVGLATANHTGHLNDSRGLGWVIKGHHRWSSAGDLFSPSSFGHTGFTGTSLWIDPVCDLFLVLLTNGVHPAREAAQHIRLRPLVANAVASAIVQ